jgi:aminomethyltransferase
LAAHEKLGAKLTEFAGWLLPLRYSQGSVKEHLATRQTVGIFDVSHLGRVVVEGPGAFDLVQYAFTNDLSKIGPAKAQYTLLLDDDGGVVDDIVVLWEADDRFVVVPNAANTAVVFETLKNLAELKPYEAAVEDITSKTAMIAVQGPLWQEVCRSCGFSELPPRFGVSRSNDVLLAGTGYTGERGVEIILSSATASEYFLDLARAASEIGGTPAGLAARDSLRLEMGYPLWGNEMDRSTSPYDAGLGWVVAPKKSDFLGKSAADSARLTPRWSLVGIVMDDKGAIPRSGYAVRTGESEGSVTSGGFSPVLSKGVALARMPAGSAEEGMGVSVDIRGTSASGVVSTPPFVKTSLG